MTADFGVLVRRRTQEALLPGVQRWAAWQHFGIVGHAAQLTHALTHFRAQGAFRRSHQEHAQLLEPRAGLHLQADHARTTLEQVAQFGRLAERSDGGWMGGEELRQRQEVHLGQDFLDVGVQERVVGQDVGVMPPASTCRGDYNKDDGKDQLIEIRHLGMVWLWRPRGSQARLRLCVWFAQYWAF